MGKGNAASRVRELRTSLQLSQEKLAELGGLERVEVSKVESGANKAQSFAMRQSLATAFGLSIEDLVELLEGSSSIATLRKRCSAPKSAA